MVLAPKEGYFITGGWREVRVTFNKHITWKFLRNCKSDSSHDHQSRYWLSQHMSLGAIQIMLKSNLNMHTHITVSVPPSVERNGGRADEGTTIWVAVFGMELQVKWENPSPPYCTTTKASHMKVEVHRFQFLYQSQRESNPSLLLGLKERPFFLTKHIYNQY